MLILISDLSKFQSSYLPASRFEFKYSRNQASKSSVNSEEHPSSEKIFQILRTCPIQSSLSADHCHQDFCMQSDREWSQHLLLSINLLYCFCSWTESSSVLKSSICFQIFVKNFALCYLPMVITIARFISVRRKYSLEIWGRCLRVWYSKFLEFSFIILRKNSK
jgi:hypothetical protein